MTVSVNKPLITYCLWSCHLIRHSQAWIT